MQTLLEKIESAIFMASVFVAGSTCLIICGTMLWALAFPDGVVAQLWMK